MSNYYTHMCAELVPKNDEARQWLLAQHRALVEFQNILDEGAVDVASEKVYEEAGELLTQQVKGTRNPALDPVMLLLVQKWDPLENGDAPGFDLEGEHGSLFFEDNGERVDLERVAAFAQLYLQKFDPEGSFSFEYANTGDVHKPDTYGGGACFVTATKIRWTSTSNWLRKQKGQFAKTRRRRG
mgnify:CR=1 FL=1